jgi:Tat protein secretion system quality control protein TatD with DNase activity
MEQASASSSSAPSREVVAVGVSPSACPCCQFLPDDLFLPQCAETADSNKDETDSGASTTDHVAGDVLHPRQAWKQLQNYGPLLVDTHSHAHLEREPSASDLELYSPTANGHKDTTETTVPASSILPDIVSLTCAVEPSDWEACLRHTEQSTRRLAALGVHPWYIPSILADSDHDSNAKGSKVPQTNATWLSDLEALLQQHSRCMVGEIGLCKMAKFVRTFADGKAAALQLQRQVLVSQLRLAAQYQRPVSIHCVNQHGVLLDALKELWIDGDVPAPPAMALHSYTGTAHQVGQLLQWEQNRQPRKDSGLPAPQPLLYFGFSHSVNYVMCRSDKSRMQGRDTVRAIPRDRLLVESDVHSSSLETLGTTGAVAYLAWALEEPIQVVARIVIENGLRFLQSLLTNDY